MRRHAALALKTLTAEVTLARAYVGRAKGLVGGEELEALAQGLVDVLEADKEFTPAMLALASMFMLQDQVARKCNTHTRATLIKFASFFSLSLCVAVEQRTRRRGTCLNAS